MLRNHLSMQKHSFGDPLYVFVHVTSLSTVMSHVAIGTKTD